MRLPLVLSAAVLFVAMTVSQVAHASAEAPLSPEVSAMISGAMTERSMGDAKAPVTIIEYSALTCSHCADFHAKVLPELKKNYIDTGKLRIVFREFPFNELGMAAAMASRCLKPEAYFDYVGAVFASQDKWLAPGGSPLIRQMAGFAGLSDEMFKACVSNKALGDHLLQQRVDATTNLKISSTPTFLIEGTLERIVGTQDYAEYAAMIDRQLARVGQGK